MTLLLCLPCCSAAAHGLNAGAVTFTGNTRFSTRQLARAAQWHWPAGRFDRDSLKQGLARLTDLYARQGYNDASAEYLLHEDTAAGRCDVRVYISEGPQYIISDIVATGNRRLTTAQLLSALSSRPGRPYDIGASGADDFQLMMLYADHGLIFAEAEHQADIGEDQRVTITYHVSEGEPVNIGRINIAGNRSVRPQAVLRELTVAPGALFSRRELARSRAQLEATGLFRDISVSPGSLSQDHAAIDLDVTLAERPRHSFETGFGYGSGDAVRLTAAWTDRDLDGWGKRLQVSGQLAFQLWTRFKLVRGTMQASYLDPWLLGRRRPASANLYYDDVRPAYTDYRLQTIGGSLQTNIYNGSYINAGTIWRQEWLRLSPNWSIP
ncbi:MAG TPA: POTRA domain-containing protein, partial [Candidatus Edwardsbacteria bacterium]|nr:POTRA domain-containing protein [Candidatus Edwardsbacteria bacterium]